MIDVDTLASLIFMVDSDEPYDTEEELPRLPEISDILNVDIKYWMEKPHDGDCINDPHICIRCHATWAYNKAVWLKKAMELHCE